jgi:hypothetical protein
MARGLTIQFRVDEAEKHELLLRCKAAGFDDLGPWLRALGLGRLETSQGMSGPAEDAGPGADDGALNGAPDGSTPTPGEKLKIDQEVEEAKLADEPAREAFVTRRTRVLYGQGYTTSAAAKMAEAEWRDR